jgi:hypothetical protein
VAFDGNGSGNLQDLETSDGNISQGTLTYFVEDDGTLTINTDDDHVAKGMVSTDGEVFHFIDNNTVGIGVGIKVSPYKAASQQGDLNDDAVTDLVDVILALQALSGQKPQNVRDDYVSSDVDVNGDNRIGLEEAIFALQVAGGLRQNEITNNFTGEYAIETIHETNISDGVSLMHRSATVNILQTDTNGLNVKMFNDEGSITTSLGISGEVAKITNTPIVLPDMNLLELIIMSDGNNMCTVVVGSEFFNPADISFTTASWIREEKPVTPEDFAGSWQFNMFHDPNLRDTTNGFAKRSHPVTISTSDSNTLFVNTGYETYILQVVGNRASLINAPVVKATEIMHDFNIVCDGEGLAFYTVVTEIDDPTDVSVSIGLGVRGTGLF